MPFPRRSPSHIASHPSDGIVRKAPWRRALVIANPISGRGASRRAAAELARGLAHHGLPTELVETQGRGHATERVRQIEDRDQLVVSVGGDGTLREILEGIVDAEAIHVGVMPFGTANVLGHELGFSRDVHRSLEILLAGKVQAMDVARVNGRLSFLCVGVGLDAEIVQEVERIRRGPITKWTYLRAALPIAFRYRPPRLRVTIDHRTLDDAFGFVLVGNLQGYGGLVHLSPEARLDDGRLEVYLFPRGSRPELLCGLTRGVLRSLPGGPVQLRRASFIRIESDGPVPYQVDGDEGGFTPVEIEVQPTRYRLVIP